jgi:hypothetical protein
MDSSLSSGHAAWAFLLQSSVVGFRWNRIHPMLISVLDKTLSSLSRCLLLRGFGCEQGY